MFLFVKHLEDYVVLRRLFTWFMFVKKINEEKVVFTLTTELIFQYLDSERALHFPVIMVPAKYFCCDDFILLPQKLPRDKGRLHPFNRRRLRSAHVSLQGHIAGE